MRACHLALLLSLAMPLAASATQSFQPMETGLQPLFDRMTEIRSEQRALIKRLEGAFASPESKARVQADYQALEKERQCIEKEIMRAAHLQNSGLVNYALQTHSSGSPFDSGALRQTD
ncbi:MAG: hypothetical protein KGL40_09275 [Rhodocyclaceae bacterium]|nr:hypothetical protein [Rhodocyclaceae bacterium]